MSPPQLPGDAPVVDVVHPVQVNRLIVLRDDRDLAVFNHLSRTIRQRLDLDEPLRGKPRLDHRPAAIAFPDRNGVILFPNQETLVYAGLRGHARGRQNGSALHRDPHSDSCERAHPSNQSAAGYGASPAWKSLGSCAGVTFTAPVPNSGFASSSVMIGISRFISGSKTFFPCRCL